MDKKFKRKFIDWIQSNGANYISVVSVLQKSTKHNINYARQGYIDDSIEYLPYKSDSVIEVEGYDLDLKHFRKDVLYDIVGISTSSNVLCIAMSMYSAGLRIRVIKDYCEDEKSKKLEDNAFEIMEAYMPGVLV